MPLTAIPGQETAAPVRRPHLGTLSTCTLRHASDERLVALTRGGSERAFAEIMRRYQRPLQFYCHHLVGGPRAEDAVQQAFMQAFVSLRDGAQREIALRPWLYRIARNCAIDLLRKQPFDHDELDPDFDGLPQPPGVFEQKEELARIVAAIQALPEGQRRALTLRELEGRSYGEISEALGHTDSGVRQLIFRARTALRNLGALIFPLDSLRWRLLGPASSGISDPHPVAAATVTSNGGGGVLQAAASVVAAAATLLSPVPPERHRADPPARPASFRTVVQPVPLVPVPDSSGAPAGKPRRAPRKPGPRLSHAGAPVAAAGDGVASLMDPPAASPAPFQPDATPADAPALLAAPDPVDGVTQLAVPAPGGPQGARVSVGAAAAPPATPKPSPAIQPAGQTKATQTIAPAKTSAPPKPAPAKPAAPRSPKPALPAKPAPPVKPALASPTAPKPVTPKRAAPRMPTGAVKTSASAP